MYTLNDFIKANKKHNFKYDYSLTNYVNMRTNIDIICPTHGSFSQNPATHLSRSGCPTCVNVRRLSNIEYIEKCKQIHNNKYDYSVTNFKNTKSKVSIKCKKHGLFEQIAGNHFRSGCPRCKGLNKLTLDEFIQKSNTIHNNKYVYSKIKSLKNNDDYVNIICPTHGIFKQRVGSHLSGNGCKSCTSKTSRLETLWLDQLNVECRQFKIDKYIVDGYDAESKTVYEFNGDFWHGNPSKFDPFKINKMLNKTFDELYRNTIAKENKLLSLGYNVISIWESEFKKAFLD
jgi:phage FluMu protein Com/very-short-patch-repair endonuclease